MYIKYLESDPDLPISIPGVGYPFQIYTNQLCSKPGVRSFPAKLKNFSRILSSYIQYLESDPVQIYSIRLIPGVESCPDIFNTWSLILSIYVYSIPGVGSCPDIFNTWSRILSRYIRYLESDPDQIYAIHEV